MINKIIMKVKSLKSFKEQLDKDSSETNNKIFKNRLVQGFTLMLGAVATSAGLAITLFPANVMAFSFALGFLALAIHKQEQISDFKQKHNMQHKYKLSSDFDLK